MLIETLEETARWNAKPVTYRRGYWDQLEKEVPQFETRAFKLSDEQSANPYQKVVVRCPVKPFEKEVPVGVVSNTYKLVQHTEVAAMCFEGIERCDIETEQLTCDLGLTELSEWMNLRIYFPDRFGHVDADGKSVGLRLECFNSVEGTSRLVVLLGWLRFVCSNGMTIGTTKTEFKNVHNKHLDIHRIPDVIGKGLALVEEDVRRQESWEARSVNWKAVQTWVDNAVTNAWGKKAASRVYHICQTGWDGKIANPFARGSATEKPVDRTEAVPGTQGRARNIYQVAQALSRVASTRKDADQKAAWQADVTRLVEDLLAGV